MIAFSYLPKDAFDRHSRALFEILADNMSLIAPTGNSREDDYRSWYQAVRDGLKASSREIVLISDMDTDHVIGFFQYYTNADTFMMEEIQILRVYQGKQVFRPLYRYVLPKLHDKVRFVEAYADKRNHQSNGILARLGLLVVGENRNGLSWHYRGSYDDLLNWFNQAASQGTI